MSNGKPIRYSTPHTRCLFIYMMSFFLLLLFHPFNAKSFCASLKGYKFTHIAPVEASFLLGALVHAIHRYAFAYPFNGRTVAHLLSCESECVCVFEQGEPSRRSINYLRKFTLQITNQITSYHTTE